MTEAEIRTMLENYRTDSANLEWWFEHKGIETDAEFYEGEQSGAVDYAKDKIQSSGEIDGDAVGLICKRARKIEHDEPDELIEKMYADKLRLHRLDCAVYELPSVQQGAIRLRYLEGAPFIKVQYKMSYSERRLYEIISDAIRAIAKEMNKDV